MVKQMTASIRGATHVDVEEVVVGITAGTLFVRGTLGTLNGGGSFVPDSALRKMEHAFKGQQALTLAQAMGVSSLWTALNDANWGF